MLWREGEHMTTAEAKLEYRIEQNGDKFVAIESEQE